MSFILDALRKSDAERQRAATPGLADVRYAARRSRRNIWLPILVVVLAANTVFMGVQWFDRGREREAAAPELSASSPTAAGQPAAARAVEPAPAADIRPLAREAEFGEPPLEPELDPEVAPAPLPVAAEVAEPVSATARPSPPAPEAAPVSPATPSRILANNELPTTEQLIGSGALNIPMLNLDLHVYSEKAANRFVVISSRKYREGGQLTEGPTVESITRDGVILAYQGQRFTLSRR
jgi:general secretion pathway protein B